MTSGAVNPERLGLCGDRVPGRGEEPLAERASHGNRGGHEARMMRLRWQGCGDLSLGLGITPRLALFIISALGYTCEVPSQLR